MEVQMVQAEMILSWLATVKMKWLEVSRLAMVSPAVVRRVEMSPGVPGRAAIAVVSLF